ncbi:peptidylprolyl isomerase [Chthonobacter rhizosphaerae]|uniref:peptidylprolyl isomerase n=1 Tax=Chthonobacter rhizosphaerae TaxID=2735553 RepID=UPI0015EFB0DD|nr:peptidylprolyl isomerase [Chthonobacter rhizosphaerae]
MLDALRRGATTWVAKLLLVLLVASFAVWGISDVFRGGQTRSVAEVGGTEIDLATFQRTYQREVQSLTRQFGQPVTYETAAALGLPQRVLGQMMSEAALTEAARQLGLGASDQDVAAEIAASPEFKTANDQFDRARFQQLLRQEGYSEASFLAEQRLQVLRRQVAEGLVGGIKVPTAMVEAIARFRNEVRTVDYAVLNRAMVEPIPAPTPEEKTAYFEENKASFRAPEYRKLETLTLTAASLADPASVTDEAARAEYDRTRGQYGTPEQRRIQQILFPTAEEAKAAADKIAAGSTFEAVAEERGLTPTDFDLGLLTRDKVVDPAIAEAAFGLAPNTVSAPVDARFGSALVRVTEVAPESIRPFEEVAGEIKASLAAKAAERTLLDTEQEIEDARAGGATLAEIAERFKLSVAAVEAVDSTGKGPDGAPVVLPPGEGLLDAAFQSDVGVENDPVRIPGGGYTWFEVASVTPARDRALEEVDAEVVRRWTDERAGELLAKKADEMVAALKGGQDFATVATAAGATVTRSPAFPRGGEVPALGEVGIDAAFGGPEGYVTAVEGDGDTHLVLRVVNAVVPPFFEEEAGNAQVAQRFTGELQGSLLTQYVTDFQSTIGTSVNQQALELAIGVAGR